MNRPLTLGLTMLISVASLLTLFACDQVEDTPVQTSAPNRLLAPTTAKISPVTPSASVSPSFDLGRIVRQVHFAFRPEGDSYSGGARGYTAKVAASGAFSITPQHHPQARPFAVPDASMAAESGLKKPQNALKAHSARPQAIIHGAPATLETQTAQVGSTALALGRATRRVGADGGLILDRGTLIEQLKNSDQGLEQSWSFATRPVGTGDLSLRVRLSGLEYVATTATGLHFKDAATGLGLCYGLATWIDARGVETPVTTRWEAGAIVLNVRAETLASSAYPALLDPIIGAEFGLDTPTVVEAPYAQKTPSVAFDGTNYLVVWSGSDNILNFNIEGTRVSQNGVVLDPSGLTFSANENPQALPKVAFDGSNYLIVWVESYYEKGYDYYYIYGMRISKAGRILDRAPLAISEKTLFATEPALVFGGSNYLVAWAQDGTSVKAARISKGGAVLERTTVSTFSGLDPSAVTKDTARPTVAYNGTNFLVAWKDPLIECRIGTMLIKPDGTTLLPANNNLCVSGDINPSSIPAAASNNTSFALFFYGGYNSVSGLYSIPVGADGSATNQAYNLSRGAIAGLRAVYTGSGYFVAYSLTISGSGYTKNGSYVVGIYVEPNGTTETSGVGIANAQDTKSYSAPDVVFDGTNLFVTYMDIDTVSDSNYANLNDIYAKRISLAGKILDDPPILLSKDYKKGIMPALAFNGTYYLAVWGDPRNPNTISPDEINYDIYGARLDVNGKLLDPAGLTISTAVKDQNYPAVGSDGKNFMVTWCDHRRGYQDLYGTQVKEDGSVTSPAGFMLAEYSSMAFFSKVAFGGTTYLATWVSERGLYGKRILPEGSVIENTPISFTGAADYLSSFAFLFDGTNYRLAWANSGKLQSMLISPNGVVLNTTLINSSMAPSKNDVPALASDGTTTLLVWASLPTTTAFSDLFGTRLNKDNAVLNTITISDAKENQLSPTATFDGTNFLVCWEDSRPKADLEAQPAQPRLVSFGQRDIYGTYISPSGDVLDPMGLLFSGAEMIQEETPLLASNGAGKNLLLYTANRRLVARTITRSNVGQACVSAGDCQEGNCVDGFCCDLPCNGACMACSKAKTGVSNGSCALTLPDTDPDKECKENASCRTATDGLACKCNPRFILSGNACVACAPGSVSNAAATACIQCQTGFYQRSNTCEACSPGSISRAGATACTICEAGTYQNGLDCSYCAPGTYSQAGQKSCSSYCSAGYYIVNQSCLPCAVDTYSTKSNSTQCQACLSGYTSEIAATACHPRCGDGKIIGNEACDDGNQQSGDGCSGTCSAIESGWSCPTAGAPCLHYCTVNGVQYVTGEVNPANDCQVCNPALSTVALSPKSAGTRCKDDGLTCTDDLCSADGACTHPTAVGCAINGSCYAAGAKKPSNDCEGCYPELADKDWTPRIWGFPCTDDGYLSTDDFCDGKRVCLHPVAQRCTIDSLSYWEGATNPTNDCEACVPLLSTTSFSPRGYGLPCKADNDERTLDICNGRGVCSHLTQSVCVIGGSEIAGGGSKPDNECVVCTPSVSTTSWDMRPAGAACQDDGNSCTRDVCDGYGLCLHPAVDDPLCVPVDGDADATGTDGDTDATSTDGDVAENDGDTETEVAADGDPSDADTKAEGDGEPEAPESDVQENGETNVDSDSEHIDSTDTSVDGDTDTEGSDLDSIAPIANSSSGGGCESAASSVSSVLLLALFGLLAARRRKVSA